MSLNKTGSARRLIQALVLSSYRGLCVSKVILLPLIIGMLLAAPACAQETVRMMRKNAAVRNNTSRIRRMFPGPVSLMWSVCLNTPSPDLIPPYS